MEKEKMTDTPMLSAQMIADELSAGIATIKFVLRRFTDYIPSSVSQGQIFYPADALGTISQIMEKLNMGDLPSQIEKGLSTEPDAFVAGSGRQQNGQDIRISEDGLTLLKSLFNDIGEQQKRIAIAHEKRAAAEERKAVAIEKRAEAEEKKALAMNNIATALQEMNQLRASFGPVAEQITHQAVAAVASDNIDEAITEIDSADIDPQMPSEHQSFTQETKEDFESKAPKQTSSNVQAEQILDDLYSLLDDKDVTADPFNGEDIDDLWSLIDQSDGDPSAQENSPRQTPTDFKEKQTNPPLDDLYALIDNKIPPGSPLRAIDTETAENLDDLSLLIDDDAKPENRLDDLDDLSLLIDENIDGNQKSARNGTTTTQPQQDMDDLSLLIEPDNLPPSADALENPKKDNDIELDDLSKLIEPDKKKAAPPESSQPQPAVKIRIDASPKDVAKYKAAIMKTILGLRSDGMTPEQTTQIFNDNHIETLSGKPEWSLKAVAQIYKFIETAS